MTYINYKSAKATYWTEDKNRSYSDYLLQPTVYDGVPFGMLPYHAFEADEHREMLKIDVEQL